MAKTTHRQNLEAANKQKPKARAEHIATLDPLTLKPNALAKLNASQKTATKTTSTT